ncbi:HNH endonuclease signature motif containing protein [Streptomyces sp. NPDC040750]|uniref:HNH endonuclease signature motif containing protein n=1 Tax=Streptomyces sp. NPDC040750 TaxID=3154491 RepID=UPI003402EF48
MGADTYPEQRLHQAAHEARTLTEALERLGADPRGSARRYVLARMRKLGVDVSHFEREGVKWTREVLERAVAASTSTCEVLRRLGLDVVGGHHTHIGRRIKAYGIDTSHFRAPTRRGAPRRPSAPEALLVEQPAAHARRVPADRLRRAMTAMGVPPRLPRCGTDAVWRGRPLPLEVDHIDGNWRDNRIHNLRFLCPNCHSTTDTYRGRGRGRTRRGAA